MPLEPLIRKLETESQLGDDERQAVRHLPFTVRNIPAGGDIVRERENPSQCCVVLEGWLCRHKITLGGRSADILFPYRGGYARFAEPAPEDNGSYPKQCDTEYRRLNSTR